jgi:hypothetical protein
MFTVPPATPTYTVLVPDTWYQLVVTLGPKLLVPVNVAADVAHVILITVGVTATVGEVKS